MSEYLQFPETDSMSVAYDSDSLLIKKSFPGEKDRDGR